MGFIWIYQPRLKAALTAAVKERTFLLKEPQTRGFFLQWTPLLRIRGDFWTFSNGGTYFVLVNSGLSSLAWRLNRQLTVKYQFASPRCV